MGVTATQTLPSAIHGGRACRPRPPQPPPPSPLPLLLLLMMMMMMMLMLLMLMMMLMLLMMSLHPSGGWHSSTAQRRGGHSSTARAPLASLGCGAARACDARAPASGEARRRSLPVGKGARAPW